MKGTIKVMNVKPDITDDEIRSFMDFDKVLAQQKAYSTKRSYRNGGVVVLSIIVVVGLWFYSRNVTEEKQAPKLESVTEQKLKNLPPGEAKKDSVSIQSVPKQPESKRKREATSKKEVVEKVAINDTATNANENTVASVYVQAEPVDGYPALYEYFARELSYPAEAVKDSVQGVVMVAFTINTSGKPEKISIEQSLGPAFDQEAVRVITNMPLWKPATYGKKLMTSRLSVPLTFQIKKTKTH